MIYQLTTPNGKVFEFYVHSCAVLYSSMYGGTLIENPLISSIQETCSTLDHCDQLDLL